MDFPTGSPILLARYLTKPDDLRADLNAFAAELETMTYSPNALVPAFPAGCLTARYCRRDGRDRP